MSNEQPLIETKHAAAAFYREMAARIEHNDPASYGGSFVVVPPGDHSEPMTLLILDPKQDPVQFWGLLKIKAEVALNALEEISRGQSAFGRGR